MTMKKYVMAFDAGTTSNRCILFDQSGKICSLAQKEFTQYFPEAGWVEHDPEEIWETQLAVAREAMRKVGAGAENIAAIGITNQRETTIVWEKNTGKPVYPAIVWQCRRTAPYCDELTSKGYGKYIKETTGLTIDAYFSGTKIRWILEHVQGAREKAENGELLFGTVETWLIWKLTGGRVHITDYSNASRTMLYNINELKWDKKILCELNIPEKILPEVAASSQVYGYTDPNWFGGEISISGAIGDQQAALFGQSCFDKGEVKNTYGTGCFLLMNIGERPVSSKNGLVTSIAWGIDGKVTYALEGSVFMGGASVQWLRDEMKLIESAKETQELAEQVESTEGCYVVPAFTGLGAPYWNPYARGMIVGMSRGTDRNQIVRATLEAIAYQVYDVLKAMESDIGEHIRELKVDGGASVNDFLIQRQSDILYIPVKRPFCVETTALGAAFLAGLAVGFWNNLDELRGNLKSDQTFCPRITEEKRTEDLEGWHRAVQCALAWAEYTKKDENGGK